MPNQITNLSIIILSQTPDFAPHLKPAVLKGYGRAAGRALRVSVTSCCFVLPRLAYGAVLVAVGAADAGRAASVTFTSCCCPLRRIVSVTV